MQTIKEAVASVQNAPSSIFAKEDVIKILESIKSDGHPGSIDLEPLIEAIKDQIESTVDNNFDNSMLDLSTAEFSLSGNEIELDSVEFETREMISYLKTAVDDAFGEWSEENEYAGDAEEVA